MYVYVHCALLQVCEPRLRKLDSLELTTGMSVTATDYMYAIFILGKLFSFGEERIGPTYCIASDYHIASRSKY
jgi:hypothetical protein